MTDRAAHAIQRLRTEVEARVGPLREVEAPKSRAEAQKMAREDPDLFDALWYARMIPASALGGDKKGGRK